MYVHFTSGLLEKYAKDISNLWLVRKEGILKLLVSFEPLNEVWSSRGTAEFVLWDEQ